MKRIIGLAIFILFAQQGISQSPPPADLDGEDLRVWLKANWYDGFHNQLGYSNARRKMYGFIDNHGDTITCVYSGFYQLNPYGNEITYPNPINTEHTVPQSFFSSNEPMQSDIYHLFPTFGTWNSERSNSPFENITDQNTVRWMRGSTWQSDIPDTFIEEYSESIPANVFEPREDHKGEVARAVAYFYTMYPNQAGTISSLFDIQTLCEWNDMDPPSSKEMERSDAIEQYQGNRNPYVDYPELLERAWGCAMTTSTASPVDVENKLNIVPNPVRDGLEMQFENAEAGIFQYTIFSSTGQVVRQGRGTVLENTAAINLSDLEAGLYILSMEMNTKSFVGRFIKS